MREAPIQYDPTSVHLEHNNRCSGLTALRQQKARRADDFNHIVSFSAVLCVVRTRREAARHSRYLAGPLLIEDRIHIAITQSFIIALVTSTAHQCE